MTDERPFRNLDESLEQSPDRFVRVSYDQTAQLWMIPKRGDPTPRVVSLHCPSCPNPENSRLVHVVLEAERDEISGIQDERRKNSKVRVLLHVTRPQVEEILASFGRHDNGDTLMDILVDKGDPDQGPDQETVQ